MGEDEIYQFNFIPSPASDHVTIYAIDITNQKKIEERLNKMAWYDALTLLPNRVYFNDALSKQISVSERYDRKFFLLFIDVDQFKLVNDNLGHAVGDELLKKFASCIHANIREGDVLARLGGDEFAAIMTDIDNLDLIDRMLEKLIKALGKPFLIEKQRVKVTASIGVAAYPSAGTTAHALLKEADRAMYFAKEGGRNQFKHAQASDEEE